MGELRVAVIDDDYWRREHMSQMLDASPLIEVVYALDQDEAARWPAQRWTDVDVALVDVIDESALGEIGSDVYSGIAAIENLRMTKVVTIALTPHRCHPLVQLRIHDAQTDFVYRRWEVNDPDRLTAAVRFPERDHAPVRPSPASLAAFGARRARPNQAVRLLEHSPLANRLFSGASHRTVRMPRRALDRLRSEIQRTGFESTEAHGRAGGTVSRIARWPETRDYLLRLLGRKDAPPTDFDGDS